jgi:uncharacterized surface protein with fasciclin (FAS1) repeats
MVSIGPYTQAYDMKHMYDFVDLRNKNKQNECNLTQNDNTLMGVITNNPDFSIFATIIEKALFTKKLSEKQADYTLFVPSDAALKKIYSEKILNNIDSGLSKQILAFSMMNRKIDKNLLQSSPISIFPTIDRSNSIHIQTICDVTYLPNNTKVIHFNQPADNGIIHVIDNLLIPEKSIY